MNSTASPTERRRAFRALLDSGTCRQPASVFDPISARLAEDYGFEAAMFAGSIAALTVLGAPDLVLLTLSEFAGQVRRITRATRRLPLMVDADHGYGNALHVMRTVEELEAAGVTALTIEDTVLPRSWGREEGPKLLPREEGLGKIKAALEARQDSSLVIVARTCALELGALGEAVSRANAYAAAGADALFFTGASTLEQVRTLAHATGKPILLGSVRGNWKPPELAAAGVRLALTGHHPFYAAVRAVAETLADLRAGTPPSALANQPEEKLLRQVSRADEYEDAIHTYLGGP